ncbi:Glycosyl transferase family 2 [compost metagenome]
MRILAASPVHQQPEILSLFLESLERLQIDNFTLDYLFVDDNIQEASRHLLDNFAGKHQNNVLPPIQGSKGNGIRQDEYTHYWPNDRVWKVASYKNALIAEALLSNYDALFLIDSDLLLHPSTLCRLLSTGKDIVSEIFWTRWQPEGALLPQVWMSDEYNLYENKQGETMTENEQQLERFKFLAKLRTPGVYEVGGLGACTLIKRNVLEDGVHFGQIPNLTFWGEDRHFCIRAASIGYSLYVDTHFPAFHLYRDSDLQEGKQFMHTTGQSKDIQMPSPSEAISAPALWISPTDIHPFLPNNKKELPGIRRQRPKLTLSMTVYNEADRKLGEVLKSYRQFIDEAVIIDDGSQDGTGDLCRELLSGIPLRLIRNETPSFSNEAALRLQQWKETLAVSPEWILNVDADEMFENSFAEAVHPLIAATTKDAICFRLYDMWSDTHYRNDIYWSSHLYYRPFLIRYRPKFSYKWRDQALHCGRFPSNLLDRPFQLSDYRIKHWGWYTAELRKIKYERYMRLDPDAQYGWKDQYDSILDPTPELVPWSE